MNTRLFNLALMFAWILLAAAMLLRDQWMSDGLREKIGDQQAYMVILVAIVFAFWNFARYFAARYRSSSKPSPEVEEYRRRIRAISGHDPKVTDPQFNFDDPSPGRGSCDNHSS
jgi:hypothetical protein